MQPDTETVPTSDAESEKLLADKLQFSVRMLHLHGLLTDAEWLRVQRRFNRRKSERGPHKKSAPKAPKATRGAKAAKPARA